MKIDSSIELITIDKDNFVDIRFGTFTDESIARIAAEWVRANNPDETRVMLYEWNNDKMIGCLECMEDLKFKALRGSHLKSD